MKAYMGLEGQIQLRVTWALDGCEQANSCSGRFTGGEEPGSVLHEGLDELQSQSGLLGKEEILLPTAGM